MTISNEIYQFISTIKGEPIAYPINAILKGKHSIAHKTFEVRLNHFLETVHITLESKCAGISERIHFVFVHAPIISTDPGALVGALCHLANWTREAADSVCVSQLL